MVTLFSVIMMPNILLKVGEFYLHQNAGMGCANELLKGIIEIVSTSIKWSHAANFLVAHSASA